MRKKTKCQKVPAVAYRLLEIYVPLKTCFRQKVPTLHKNNLVLGPPL